MQNATVVLGIWVTDHDKFFIIRRTLHQIIVHSIFSTMLDKLFALRGKCKLQPLTFTHENFNYCKVKLQFSYVNLTICISFVSATILIKLIALTLVHFYKLLQCVFVVHPILLICFPVIYLQLNKPIDWKPGIYCDITARLETV